MTTDSNPVSPRKRRWCKADGTVLRSGESPARAAVLIVGGQRPISAGCARLIAESFVRIHRSNLVVGIGILPLQFKEGQNVESLGLTGKEVIDIIGLDDNLKPRQAVTVRARGDQRLEIGFTAMVRIDTPIEVEYYRNGGILQTILRKLVRMA